MASLTWYKGNIHTHTDKSDGDSSPEAVVAWYRKHDYDFLVLSDHNHRTILDYPSGKRRFKRPLMIPGEEVSIRIHDGAIPIHIGGIGISRMVEPVDAIEIVPTLQANVDAILAADGIAALNHPNYVWAFDHEHISQLRGAHMVEIFNGHPRVNLHGAGGKPGYEEIWDNVLTTGLPIWGVATDDSHHFKGEFSSDRVNPGRGWIVVRAERLEQDDIMDAMRAGNFYSSTGVTLDDLEIGADKLSVGIEQEGDTVYSTRFIGSGGTLLSEVHGVDAEYVPIGDEGYVRVCVIASNGTKAWTQPIFLNTEAKIG